MRCVSHGEGRLGLCSPLAVSAPIAPEPGSARQASTSIVHPNHVLLLSFVKRPALNNLLKAVCGGFPHFPYPAFSTTSPSSPTCPQQKWQSLRNLLLTLHRQNDIKLSAVEQHSNFTPFQPHLGWHDNHEFREAVARMTAQRSEITVFVSTSTFLPSLS